MQGTLTVSSSQAYVQFATPSSTAIDSILYTLDAYSGGIAGRVNLSPPSSNFGLVTLNGTVGVVSGVPEPTSLGLAAVSAVALLRRRNRSHVSA